MTTAENSNTEKPDAWIALMARSWQQQLGQPELTTEAFNARSSTRVTAQVFNSAVMLGLGMYSAYEGLQAYQTSSWGKLALCTVGAYLTLKMARLSFRTSRAERMLLGIGQQHGAEVAREMINRTEAYHAPALAKPKRQP
jgi:hypothetical protein